jgi:hypothetical protein
MLERAGSAVVEVPGSHAIYVSQPAAVASLIMQASNALFSIKNRVKCASVAGGIAPVGHGSPKERPTP